MKPTYLTVLFMLICSLSTEQSYAEETQQSMDKLLDAAQSLMTEQQTAAPQAPSDELLLNNVTQLMQEQNAPPSSKPASNAATNLEVKPPATTTTTPSEKPQPTVKQESVQGDQPESAPPPALAEPPPAPRNVESTSPPVTTGVAAIEQPLPIDATNTPAESANSNSTTGNKSYGSIIKQKNASGEMLLYFKVEEGASLSAIAGQIYQDPMKFSLIYEANQDHLLSPDRVPVGALLVIPAAEGLLP